MILVRTKAAINTAPRKSFRPKKVKNTPTIMKIAPQSHEYCSRKVHKPLTVKTGQAPTPLISVV